jgi:hypothetical protein
MMVTLGGIEHVGRSIAPAGEFVNEQKRYTPPPKPLDGVTVTVAVLPVVAPGLSVMFPLEESANASVFWIVTPTVVLD